jgi:hypothetical protein
MLLVPASGGLTMTSTVSAVLTPPRLSVTANENVRVVALDTLGAAKVGNAVVAPVSVTAAPADWVHA